MKVETLRAEMIDALRDLAWGQWSQLGVSSAPPAHREERAADPEALLLFTLHVGRHDPRLFDEVLDWLALNGTLVSVQRLRNLCISSTDRALVDAALDWAVSARRRRVTVTKSTREPADRRLEALFPALPTPRENPDPSFARHGFRREPLTASRKSKPPRIQDPISFAFRLRKLLGVGVRAEVVRTLLTIRAPRLSGSAIIASAGFAQRNVREGLAQLHDAGVVDAVQVADQRHYAIGLSDWATLLRMPTPALPLHYDWIPAYRALTRILAWTNDARLDELSPYLRASRARTLAAEIDSDLRYIGVSPQLSTAPGADFWDEFADVSLAAVQAVGGTR